MNITAHTATLLDLDLLPQRSISKSPLETPQHKSTNEYYTPAEWVNFARVVFGQGIDLDPASCELANVTVKANRIYTKDDDGLSRDWTSATLWLNPPYSKGWLPRFSAKLIDSLPNIGQAMMLVNATPDTAWFRQLYKSCDRLMFTDHRICFTDANGVKQKGNNRSQALFYFGPNSDRFDDLTASRGAIVVSPHWRAQINDSAKLIDSLPKQSGGYLRVAIDALQRQIRDLEKQGVATPGEYLHSEQKADRWYFRRRWSKNCRKKSVAVKRHDVALVSARIERRDLRDQLLLEVDRLVAIAQTHTP